MKNLLLFFITGYLSILSSFGQTPTCDSTNAGKIVINETYQNRCPAGSLPQVRKNCSTGIDDFLNCVLVRADDPNVVYRFNDGKSKVKKVHMTDQNGDSLGTITRNSLQASTQGYMEQIYKDAAEAYAARARALNRFARSIARDVSDQGTSAGSIMAGAPSDLKASAAATMTEIQRVQNDANENAQTNTFDQEMCLASGASAAECSSTDPTDEAADADPDSDKGKDDSSNKFSAANNKFLAQYKFHSGERKTEAGEGGSNDPTIDDKIKKENDENKKEKDKGKGNKAKGNSLLMILAILVALLILYLVLCAIPIIGMPFCILAGTTANLIAATLAAIILLLLITMMGQQKKAADEAGKNTKNAAKANHNRYASQCQRMLHEGTLDLSQTPGNTEEEKCENYANNRQTANITNTTPVAVGSDGSREDARVDDRMTSALEKMDATDRAVTSSIQEYAYKTGANPLDVLKESLKKDGDLSKKFLDEKGLRRYTETSMGRKHPLLKYVPKALASSYSQSEAPEKLKENLSRLKSMLNAEKGPMAEFMKKELGKNALYANPEMLDGILSKQNSFIEKMSGPLDLPSAKPGIVGPQAKNQEQTANSRTPASTMTEANENDVMDKSKNIFQRVGRRIRFQIYK